MLSIMLLHMLRNKSLKKLLITNWVSWSDSEFMCLSYVYLFIYTPDAHTLDTYRAKSTGPKGGCVVCGWNGPLFAIGWPVVWGMRDFLRCRTFSAKIQSAPGKMEHVVTLVFENVKLKEIQPKFLTH